jgi:MATE family multidrug resistance protein
LKWIEEDTYILAVADKFLKTYLLVVPFDGLSLILRMYIATTDRIRILLYMNIIGNVVNILSHYICLYYLQIGIRAAPISITLAYVSLVITGILYIRFSSMYEETWHPITRACLQEWNVYLKLALPGVVSMM